MARGRPKLEKTIRRELRKAASAEAAKTLVEELEDEINAKIESTPKGRVPGLTRGSTKINYTYQDLCGMFPFATFTPEETILLTFQGVPVQARANIEMHVPECFKNVYDQHRRELRANTSELRGLGINVDLGAGSLT